MHRPLRSAAIRITHFAGTAALVLFNAPAAIAGGLDVCASGCHFTTIQAALDHARPGETIDVGQGVYPEALVISDKSLTLRGQSARRTIIAGKGNGAVVTLACAAPSTHIRLVGLTITGGHPDPSNPAGGRNGGGGISNQGCSLSLDNSDVASNTAFGSGGGILSTGPLLVSDSVIANNSGSSGGGLFVSGPTRIVRTLVEKNTGTGRVSETGGGGILSSSAELVIEDSDIIGNDVGFGCCRGGGIYNIGTMRVRGSRVADNVGVGVFNAGSAQFDDSSIVGNVILSGQTPPVFATVRVAGGVAGGIDSTGRLALTRSLVSNNLGFGAGGISSTGALSVVSSVIASNDGRKAGSGAGGGIYNGGNAVVDGASIVGNTADTGGGIFNNDGATISLKHSTVADNTPDNCAGNGVSCP